ncbi:hypothetical protein [Micromonospora echinofusca]|uniref:hypothetical protein n=1 Tax=Micromonospora echinofusca TaxID=47858 RepID=UPI0033DE90D0
MAKLRGEERWVKACIEATLPDAEVEQHDDGSKPGMHDLDLIRSGQRFGAVEITSAADPESIPLWKLINKGQRWIEPQLAGGWFVSLLPSARGKRVRAELPSLLAELERLGITEVSSRRRPLHPVAQQLDALGVVTAGQGGTEFPGSIYPTIHLPDEKSGGMVADAGDALASWFSDWLPEPDQADNLQKLARSAAPERHLFVIFPGFTTAPFSVADLLMRNGAPLPTVPPALPPEITHVWAISTWNSGDGFRWSPADGWSRFSKVFQVTDGD